MERWKVNLYTLWVTQLFSLMGFGLCVPFIPFFLQVIGVSDPVQLHYYTGISSTLPAATMAISAPVWGFIADRFGRKIMIIRAMLCSAILLASMGISQRVWQFLVLRSLQGVFSGTITASMGFVSVNTPVNKRAYALGLMTSSNFLGYSIGPFIGGILAEIVGYRGCFYLGGLLVGIGAILAIALIKEDKSTYGKIFTGSDEKGEKESGLITPLVLLLLLTVFLQRLAKHVFTPYLALFVQANLGTVSGAASYTGIINGSIGLATALAAVTIPRLGDKYNKMKLTLLLTFISFFVTLLLPFSTGLLNFMLIFTIYYFVVGAAEPILTSLAAENVPISMGSALFGLWGTVTSLAAMVAPMVGAGISVAFGLKSVLIVLPIVTLVQIICLYVPGRRALTGKKREGM
ncbi:MAG: MFS transporter [Anaerovoracaceae bacterium]|jgi:DHA1 family multidrug resistance protein-like MFS transporter